MAVPPLLVACEGHPLRCTEIVAALLEAGADPNQGSHERATPLLVASYRPCPGIVQRLLQAGAQTGDLLLFSSRHAASNITKCFTASAWDHVAIIVTPSPGYSFIAEWAGGMSLHRRRAAPLQWTLRR